MKFTIAFLTLLSISTSWAVLAKRVEDLKDKREAPVGYPSSGQSYQAPSLGHGDASAINVAAGYSIGGAKPSYSFGDFGSGAQLQLPAEGLHSGGQGAYQLAPITLQPGHGSISGTDLSQIMSQLSHSINSGALTLTPSNNVAEFHTGGEGSQGGQEISFPQFSYGAPKFQQYTLSESQGSAPSYSAGTKGLGSYGSTGPVLFNPSQAQTSQLTYNVPSSGHSFGDAGSFSLGAAGHSLGGAGGHSLGGSGGHSLGGSAGYTLGGSGGHALGGSAGYSLGSSGGLPLGSSGGHSLGGHSIGGSGNSFGGSYKNLGASYVVPSKGSFKPSAYLGSSVQGDSGHGLSAISGSYSSPSLSGGLSLGSGSHGASFGNSFAGFGSGSAKYLAPTYQSPKSEGFGSNLESVASFSSSGHLASPPGTTYGIPSSSYSGNNAHAASSASPQYYVSSSKHSAPSSFGEGSTSYRAPISSHSSLSSYSSGPKYSFGGHGLGSRYSSPKDSHGAYSEASYNTIKYSEELKPRAH